MTDRLEQAIAQARALPADQQDDVADWLLRLVGYQAKLYVLTPEEAADLAAADDEVAAGDIASVLEVEAVFGKYKQ